MGFVKDTRFLSAKEVAELLDVSAGTVINLTKRKELMALKNDPGKKTSPFLYNAMDIDNFMNTHEKVHGRWLKKKEQNQVPEQTEKDIDVESVESTPKTEEKTEKVYFSDLREIYQEIEKDEEKSDIRYLADAIDRLARAINRLAKSN